MEIEKGICPLCGGKNGCAVAGGEDPYSCWCMTTDVPEALLEMVPEEVKGKSCVCKKCVEKYLNEKQGG